MLVRGTRGQRRSAWAQLVARARTIRHDESGMAILTVITVITVGLAVGGVAAVTATNAMRGSTRDEDSKDALAAADAGAQIALMRQNQIAVNDALPCVVSAAGTYVAGAASTGGWCAPVSGTSGDVTFTYRVRPPVVSELLSRVEVVSTATADGVTRRLHTVAESPRANAIFIDSTVVADNSITLNNNSTVTGNAATNGNITLSNNSSLCGAATHGDGMAVVVNQNGHQGGAGCSQATYPNVSGSVTLPPVDQGDVVNPIHNDNDRIDPANPLAPDTISGNRTDVTFTNRMLTINSNSALTLGGHDYSLCKLTLRSNSSLIVAAGASVRIFFDAPENCPGLGAGPQISLESNSRLTTTNGGPGNLQLLVVGSANPSVQSDNVVFSSNSHTTMPVILYAPRSAVELASNSTIVGAVAGQSVQLDGNARVDSHQDSSSLELPLPLKYKQTQFVECSATAAPESAPTSSC
jgi:predicted acyltransferase (DUF342 family)